MHLLQLELLELLNRFLKSLDLLLSLSHLSPVSLLYLGRDLLLVSSIQQNLLLPLDARAGLVKLLLRLGDFGVDVDTALDVEEDGRGCGDGVRNTARGARGIRTENVDVVDGFTGERLN